MSQHRNILEYVYEQVVEFIQKNGWYIVLLVIVLYNMRPYYEKFMEQRCVCVCLILLKFYCLMFRK